MKKSRKHKKPRRCIYSFKSRRDKPITGNTNPQHPAAVPTIVRVSPKDPAAPAVTAGLTRKAGPTASSLLNTPLEPLRWAVPDLIPEGLTLLVGKRTSGILVDSSVRPPTREANAL